MKPKRNHNQTKTKPNDTGMLAPSHFLAGKPLAIPLDTPPSFPLTPADQLLPSVPPQLLSDCCRFSNSNSSNSSNNSSTNNNNHNSIKNNSKNNHISPKTITITTASVTASRTTTLTALRTTTTTYAAVKCNRATD